MAIPNPNPNIADGIKSDNKTYSSNKIESLIKTATELPIPEAGDAGKVLTVNSDSDGYELDVIPDELPTPAAGDAGKVLTVNAGETGYELDTITHPDPTFTRIDTADFFVSDTNIGTFDAFKCGKLVIIQRLTFTDVTTSGIANIAAIKSDFLPDANIIRCSAIINSAFAEVDLLKADSAFKSSASINNQAVHITNLVYVTV